jgi:hypothetical protein
MPRELDRSARVRGFNCFGVIKYYFASVLSFMFAGATPNIGCFAPLLSPTRRARQLSAKDRRRFVYYNGLKKLKNSHKKKQWMD